MSHSLPKTVLITGGGGGIGSETARHFTRAGARVVIFELQQHLADAIAAELPDATVMLVDLGDSVAVADAFDQLEAAGVVIDVLINNAAHTSLKPLPQLTEADIAKDLHISLAVPMMLSQRVLPGMIERGEGIILNVASVNGLMYFGNESYSAAKAGLISLTRSLAVQYGPRGIRSNAVAPGTILTPAWESRIAEAPEIMTALSQWYPSGRIGRPADVAEALVFLASDAAAWISGVCLPIDGGLTAGNLKMTQDMLVDIDRR